MDSLIRLVLPKVDGQTYADAITGGGLPRGRTTLLVDGPGPGKALPALQFQVYGARDCREPGISGASPASDRPPK